MLISLCIPVMDRLPDLRRTMPRTIRAASVSPPCEICVLDYGSSDGLSGYLRSIQGVAPMLSRRRIEAEHYHKARAWNLVAGFAHGEYLVMMGSDALLREGYISVLRAHIAKGATWMRGKRYKGIVCIRRDEFEAMGGYDDRFEYSGEDKELDERLRRRGAKFGLLPDGLVSVIRTPNALKVARMRGGISKAQAMAHGEALRRENAEAGLLVANAGKEAPWD